MANKSVEEMKLILKEKEPILEKSNKET